MDFKQNPRLALTTTTTKGWSLVKPSRLGLRIELTKYN